MSFIVSGKECRTVFPYFSSMAVAVDIFPVRLDKEESYEVIDRIGDG